MNKKSYQELSVEWINTANKIAEAGNIIKYNPANTSISALDMKIWAQKVKKLNLYIISLTSQTLTNITEARMNSRARKRCPFCDSKITFDEVAQVCNNTECHSNNT